jgi:acyl carrier protein
MLNERDLIRRALREFIVTQTGLPDRDLVTDDADLFSLGVMDSFMTVALVAFCEEHFAAELPIVELGPENFSSIDALTDLITRHQFRGVEI